MNKKLSSYYEKNKNKPIKEWLKLKKKNIKDGKQGSVGILCHKDLNFFYKTSLRIDHLIKKEYCVMNDLNELSLYCPHFSRCIGVINTQVEVEKSKDGDIFNITSKYPIEKEVILCEYLKNSILFSKHIKSELSEKIIYSIIKQVLLCLWIAQKEKKFTHYDLHSDNILIKRCNKNVVFLYILDEENQFAVPTYGYYPVIIDFGFSYSKDLEDGPLWGTLVHTDLGFITDRFDWVADPKLFLVSVSYEINKHRRTKESKLFRKRVRKIFSPLSINWKSGWDITDDVNVCEFLARILNDYSNISKLFEYHPSYCIDLIQTLIITPLEYQDYENIEENYILFLEEWVKIENEFSNLFYNLYILKGLVDSARCVRSYFCEETTKQLAISTFKHDVFENINKVSKFCRPKNINFEKMLSSLYSLSLNIEGLFYNLIENRMQIKQKEYNKLSSKSIEQIFAYIDCNIEIPYEYTKQTNIIIIDSVKKKQNVINLQQNNIEIINKLDTIYRGTFIYDNI